MAMLLSPASSIPVPMTKQTVVLPSISNLMSPPESQPLDLCPDRQHYSRTPSRSPTRSMATPMSSASMAVPAHAADKAASPSQIQHVRQGSKGDAISGPRLLPSPPVSPWQDHRRRDSSAPLDRDSQQQQQQQQQRLPHLDTHGPDPVLFADSDPGLSISSQDHEPLFAPEPIATTDELISKHMALHLTQFKNKLNRPTRDEYRLALACVPTIGAHYNRSPSAYLKRQRAEQEQEYWQIKRLCAHPGHRSGSTASITTATPATASRATGSSSSMSLSSKKRAIQPLPGNGSGVRLPRVRRTTPSKPSPMTQLMHFPLKGRAASETPDRAHPVKRDDTDYTALPDYCPPLSSLPDAQIVHPAKVLKADWPASNTLDLSADPDRHLLHPAEVHLAATLRLTCATYLCSKRRIFESRLTAMRIGKDFRKTDAQQACKIDVNKASKLWTAFDKVGWFDRAYFERYLV